MKNLLLIVDPQNDFVDPKGSLYVKDAEKTIGRICKFIKTRGSFIDHIIISQDSHQKYNIGFPGFWNIKGIKEFDNIKVEDILSGKATPHYIDPIRKDMFLKQFKKYRHDNLTVWPYHCLEGSWGWCFPEELVEALNEWGFNHNKTYEIFRKGYIPEIEAYSIFPSIIYISGMTASVPRPQVFGYQNIYISGFCKDICVAETVYDLKAFSNRLTILDNCMATLDPSSKNLEIYNNLPGAKIEIV